MVEPDVVEFDVPVSGPDEELATSSPSPGLTRLVVSAAVVLVGAGLALRAGTTPHRADVPPLPSPAVTQVDERPDNHIAVQDPAQCPPSITCFSQVALPQGFIAAVRARLPNVVVDDARQILQTNPPSLYFRRLSATSGTTTVVIVVSRFDITRNVHPAEYVMRAPGATIAAVSLVTLDRFFVQVQYEGPAGWHPAIRDIRALASDPRLRAVR